MVRRLQPSTIRQAVEKDALVATREDTLFELLCAFAIEKELKGLGWKDEVPPAWSARGGFLWPRAVLAPLRLYDQSVAEASVSKATVYQQVQEAHGLGGALPLRPDLIFAIQVPGLTRWVLGEVKGGTRSAADSARQALLDLLAYRRNYDHELTSSMAPYGLGIAWGSELEPKLNSEVMLCTARHHR